MLRGMISLTTLTGGLTALGAVSAAAIDHGIRYKSSRLMDRSIYRGPGDRKAVALTFDDGPSPSTLDLLAYLREQHVRATFFQGGLLVKRYPAIAQQVHGEGHEIGNHGYSHVRLKPQLGRPPHVPSLRFIYRELAETQRLLTEICGEAPRLFRAPYGKRWVGLDLVRKRLGLLGVQWTVIGHDWEWPAKDVAQHVLRHSVPGAIICLHDGRADNDASDLLRALDMIIPTLRDQGYSFETVSELLREKTAPQLVAATE